jgi:hypothetical protein
MLIAFLWLDSPVAELTILHCENAPEDAREVSDLSAKIMAAMAGRRGTAASTRVNYA